MRTLHVIPSISLVRGGPSQAVLDLVRAIRPLGVDAEIVTTNDDGPTVLNVPLRTLIDHEGVPVRFFPRFSPPMRFLWEFAYSRELTMWLRKHLVDYDIVHVHAAFSYVPSSSMRLARRARIPYINRPSGLFCRWSMQQRTFRKRLFLALFERANLEGAAALEFTAEQEQDETADLGFSVRSFVLPYGLHIPRCIDNARQRLCAKLQLSPSEPVILFLSRLHPKKGAHLLLEAVENLSTRFTVLVAGSGAPEYEQQLTTMANRERLKGRVKFVGFAAGEFKQLLLQGADLFVLPSHSESFAIAALEALAAGTPVLTTPAVPLAYLIRKFDLGWVENPDPEALRETLRAALKQVGQRDKMESRRKLATQLVERNFSWPRIASRTADVYGAILGKQELPSFTLAQVSL